MTETLETYPWTGNLLGRVLMETIDVRDISYGNLVACDTWKNVLEKGEDFKWHHGGETHSP